MGSFNRSVKSVAQETLFEQQLSSLRDVDTTTPSTGQVLKWDGSKWGPGSDDEKNTASNAGSYGSGLFKRKTGDNLEFKNISSGSTKISIANDTGHVNIDVVSANINTADLNNNANFGIVAGSNTYLQFNNNNELGASANLTWDGLNFEVTGNVAVNGILTANSYHVTYVTSSVLHQSGSTRFGNSADDVHAFTGSVQFLNSLSASTVTSTFIGEGTSITNVNAVQLNSQVPSYYLDYTNFVVDDNEISGDKVHGGSISGLTELTSSNSSLGTAIATTLSASKGVSANTFYGDGSNLTGISSVGHTIQSAGSSVTDRTYLNFTGSGVSVADDSGNNATKITINVGEGSGEVNTASNEGSGIGLAMSKENSNLPFKTLVAGSNISFVTSSNEITIAYKPPSVDYNAAPDSGFTVGTRILGDTGLELVAGGVSRLFITGSGYVGLNVTGSAVTHRLTLPNSSTSNDGKAVAFAWATYSSQRYKEEIKTIENPIGIVEGLRGVSYKWRDSQMSDIGFIAEEVGKVLPQVVQYESDGINAKSMDYARITSILVEAVKSQQRQIDELKKLIK